MNNASNKLLQDFESISRKFKPHQLKELFSKPIFIISAPRSGSTLLFETLSRNPDLWTIGAESHSIFNAIPNLHPRHSNYESGRLTERHADAATKRLLRSGFTMFLRSSDEKRYLQLPASNRPKSIRFLEKTPRNALNIPFINKIFPGAKFVFLFRQAESNINSIIEAWNIGLNDGSFVTFPNLPGWHLGHWCMPLPPGWRKLQGCTIEKIAEFQWQSCNDIILRDLGQLEESRWTSVSYEDFLGNPKSQIQRLCRFANIRCHYDAVSIEPGSLPLSKTTVTPPAPDKWKKRATEILPLIPALRDTTNKLSKLKY